MPPRRIQRGPAAQAYSCEPARTGATDNIQEQQRASVAMLGGAAVTQPGGHAHLADGTDATAGTGATINQGP